MKSTLKIAFITISACLLNNICFAQGILDLTFGNNGKVTTPVGESTGDSPTSAVIQADGNSSCGHRIHSIFITGI